MRLFTIFLYVSLAIPGLAQKKASLPLKASAVVEVNVVDENKRARKGELVRLDGKYRHYTGRTNALGIANFTVATGDEYAVSVKAVTDSSQFGLINIPVLKEGETYTGKFEVEIVYEPAVSFTLDNVQFDVGKATLRPSSFKELSELAEYLKWKENQQIEIAGHTDNAGSSESNQKLSQQRADAARNFLLGKGINPALVIAKGYGATQPIADNSTAEGKQKNRRTEVRLVKKDGQ